jgi:hypothetical protein
VDAATGALGGGTRMTWAPAGGILIAAFEFITGSRPARPPAAVPSSPLRGV